MKIKAIFVLIMTLLVTGCSTGMSAENLLQAPKLDPQQNDIYQALINSSGTNLKLKYPKSGDYRSAFVIKNFDDEPTEEALVFYENTSVQSGEAALRLKVLDQYDGKWQAVYDLACIGSEVESISFTTIGKGNSTDIIVRYSMLNQTEKAFSVISYADGIPSELYAASYSSMEVIDLNNDGFNELVTVHGDKTTGVFTAMMFGRTENGLEKISEISLSGTGAEVINTTKGKLSENVPALFIDYSMGQQQYGTNVVYCSGDRLISPDSVGKNEEGRIISRFTNDYMTDIFSTDIDGDGFVEVPCTIPLPGYEILTKSEQLCAVQWYTVKVNDFVLKHYGYYSSKFSFVLLFPNRWQGVVTAVPNLQNNEIVFISYTSDTGLTVNERTELMRIRIVDKNNDQQMQEAASMRVIAETDEAVYCYSVTDGFSTGKLALTDSELKNSFIVF